MMSTAQTRELSIKPSLREYHATYLRMLKLDTKAFEFQKCFTISAVG